MPPNTARFFLASPARAALNAPAQLRVVQIHGFSHKNLADAVNFNTLNPPLKNSSGTDCQPNWGRNPSTGDRDLKGIATAWELVIFWVIQSSAQYRIGPEFLCSLTQTPMTRAAVPPSSPAIDPQHPARESPPSALFTRVLTIYDNRWWRDENERKGGMSTAGSQRITTDDTLRDEVAGDGGRGDGIERAKTVSWGCSGTARATY
ncbi:hypothetical protein B0H14DRAFT_2581945 [Mycena olivaceomarginata]|nr:hypothetical protein B0H14DRAFT_2581945 [Mycena olivaceomarginata]